MQIGNICLSGRLILAPMAGVTDRAFRQICREHGAALSVSEMVSTRALLFQDRKSQALLLPAPNEKPFSVQIFGHEPETMAAGAAKAQMLSGCDCIDINMGCPAPKIVNNGDGSALMRDPETAARVIEAVKKAVPVPVTVKFRMGWDEKSVNCLEFAKMAEQAGADAICVHGRTRSQQYSGTANWDIIRSVKEQAGIPVIANGDVFTPEDAVRIFAQTGADLVMVGRGSLGDPWLFERANALLAGEPLPPLPPLALRLRVAVRQIELAAADKGERVAMLEARKHVNWYLKGVPRLKEFKVRVSSLTTLRELYTLAEDLLEEARRRGLTGREGLHGDKGRENPCFPREAGRNAGV